MGAFHEELVMASGGEGSEILPGAPQNLTGGAQADKEKQTMETDGKTKVEYGLFEDERGVPHIGERRDGELVRAVPAVEDERLSNGRRIRAGWTMPVKSMTWFPRPGSTPTRWRRRTASRPG